MELIEILLNKKAEENNIIDLSAYTSGLQDMYTKMISNGVYTEEKVKTMCINSLRAFCENVYFGEPNWEVDFDEWFKKNKACQ